MMGGRRQIVLALSVLAMAAASARAAEAPRVSVVVAPGHGDQPIDGRLLLLLSTDPAAEPRMQIGESVATQMVFGMDVDGVRPGQPIDRSTPRSSGYPISKLSDVPAGDYYVQVVLHRYETFHRADGHTVKLPMDRGEGQHWNLAPGNLYSTPQKVTIGGDGGDGGGVARQGDSADSRGEGHEVHPSPEDPERAVDEVLGPADVPQRERAGARGLRRASERAYPADDFRGPLQPRLRRLPDRAARSEPEAGPQRALSPRGLQPNPAGRGYKFYQQWIGAASSRGFWSSQINAREPVLRRLIRRELGESRPVWRCDRDGADPRDRETVSWDRPGLGALRLRRIDGWLGSDGRAAVLPGPLQRRVHRLPRPGGFPRLHHGQHLRRQERLRHAGPAHQPAAARHAELPGRDARHGQEHEPAGARARVTRPLRRAVRHLAGCLRPAGDDGYPKPIFDKATGEIDRSVAAYWKEHYDLRAILQRDWSTLGPKLQGKLHVYVGSADTYFLNNAVYYSKTS